MSKELKDIPVDASTRLAAERTRLAYGRTLLGWIRTAVSLITFGFSIYQFFRIAKKGVEDEYLLGPREFGLLMIVMGLISLLIATWEHRRSMRALKAEFPDIRGSSEMVLAFMVAILGIVGLVASLVRH